MNINNGNGAKLNHSSNGAGLTPSLNAVKIERSSSGAGLNHLQNLTSAEGAGSVSPLPTPKTSTSKSKAISKFDQPVLLTQSNIWSRAILWGLMGVTTTAVVWASIAKIEEAIPAVGKLEPQGTVKEVQAPIGGVVKAIYVEDGQRVRQGDRLLSFDPTAAKSQLASLQTIRTSLLQENQFYTAILRGASDRVGLEVANANLKLPPQLISLTKSRAALVAENKLFRAQISGSTSFPRLNSEQQERLQSNAAELNSRVAAAQSEVAQLTKQLSQTNIQLASAKDTLKMNQGILNDIIPLANDGAISRLQYLKQQQEVRNALSEVQQLEQEQARLKLEINEGQSKVQNTLALDRKEELTKIADNDKRIAEIDSQLTKAIVENNKRLAEINSQLTEAQLSLQYQEIQAPSSGTVFELQPHSTGFVATQSQPILKIVPDDALTAKVFITNQDIGFVKEGMAVDVRVDSFPFSEFGDVKGKLVWIGSDALPPDQIHPFYRFPAKVRLNQQYLLVNGRQVPLQSGMSVSTNMKVRSRTVMSIFTDLFTKNIEGLKFVR